MHTSHILTVLILLTLYTTKLKMFVLTDAPPYTSTITQQHNHVSRAVNIVKPAMTHKIVKLATMALLDS